MYAHLNNWKKEEQISFRKIFQNNYTIIFFLAPSLICLLIYFLTCIKHIWNLVHSYLFAQWFFFLTGFKCFFRCIVHSIGSFHPLTLGLSHCICEQPLHMHLFHCARGEEKTTSHDVVCDAFASIMKDVRFHILHEQTHVFLSFAFQSSHWQINILVSMDGV